MVEYNLEETSYPIGPLAYYWTAHGAGSMWSVVAEAHRIKCSPYFGTEWEAFQWMAFSLNTRRHSWP